MRRGSGDQGSAVVEFLALGLLLLLPLAYLVLVLARLQAGAFAVQAAASSAAQAAAAAPDPASAQAAVDTAVALAVGDQRFGAADATTSTACSSVPCLQPSGRVSVTVRLAVALPGVPSFLRDVVPDEVPLSAQASQSVDRFAARSR